MFQEWFSTACDIIHCNIFNPDLSQIVNFYQHYWSSTKKILSLIIITFFIFFDPIKLLLDIIMLKCFIIDLSSTQPSIMHRDFFRTWLRKSLLCGRKYKIYNCKWFALPIAQMKENYQIFLLIDAINECSKLSFAKEFYLFF